MIKNREDVGRSYFDDPNAFIECSNRMDDVYHNIDDYNPSRQIKILIVFDDMIAEIMANKNFQAVIKELFIRCRKLNISLVFITQSYFSVPKDVRLNSTDYLIMKINNRKHLQNIAINHSGDIDYNDFVRIYKVCTRKPCSFLTIDTILPASDPLRFRKNLLLFIKMTVTDQLKIIDNKIKANQAQNDLDRLAANISAYSSGNLRKYEYLTGKDLGYKPSVFEQAKFDYYPLGNIFLKGLDKYDKKEGLFKRLENIKDKSEELLNAFSAANKVSNAAKNENDYNYDPKYAFYLFFRSFEKFKGMVSLDSKHGELKKFYKLLSDWF